jgi:pimeloyl-ACP methyl ester carboxylesterase
MKEYMKTIIMKTSIKMSLIALALCAFFSIDANSKTREKVTVTTPSITDSTSAIKNIVLVHGAFVDGSGWKPVFDILVKKGYHVSIVQQPLTSFTNDVNAVKRVLDMQNGPCILVAHSYGGAIITEAGNDAHVAGLVYIAAHAPDKGENEAANGKLYPPAYKSLQKTADGFDYIDPASFYRDFAADMPKDIAEFTAYAQMLTADEVFHAVIQNPAWRSKPSWYLVAKSDRIINPELERMYAKRANSHKVEIEGASHSVYESHPSEVAQLIIKAATQSGKKN